MILLGKDIQVYEGSTPTAIGSAKSCTINMSADTVETSSPSSPTARTYASGRTGWEVQVSKLVTNMKSDLLRNGTVVTLSMIVNNNDRVSGTAICTNVQVTGEVGKLAQCSCTFLGSGELS